MNEPWKSSEENTDCLNPEANVPAGGGISRELTIEGLNIEKGIALTGKNTEYYLKILSIYHRDGTSKKEEIEECLKTENIALYTIHIHAIKSASALIGADIISKDAAELEEAGKQGDITFIKSRSHAFLADLERLLRAINNALASDSIRAGKSAKISTETNLLKPELLRLKRALIAFDYSEIYKADSVLQQFTYAPDIGDSVSAILQYKLIGDYEKAISLIDKML